MNNHETEIQLIQITKKFGNFTAVQNVNLEIHHGEFFSLLGPSGCGKTTTLRMIAGLEEPTEGQICLAGEDVTYKPAYLRNVNTVFQDYALFPHMTVEENIYFPLKMKKVKYSSARAMIEEALSLVNMTGFGKRYPQQLSGGQRQRIALARSLVNRPRALLLDEPLGALDFKLRIAMQKVLKDIQKNVDITFIYVTHDQTEAITMSDRICVMKDGVIHQIGTPDEIYNSPESTFVASFIGDMNFLECQVVQKGENSITIDVDGKPILSTRFKGSFSKGDSVVACIRPEKICLDKVCDSEFQNKFENHFQASIHRIVFRGTDYEITIKFGQSEIRLIESASDFNDKKIGDQLFIGFQKDDVITYLKECKKVCDYETNLDN